MKDDNKNKLQQMMDEASSSTNDSDVEKKLHNTIAPKQKRWPWYAGGAAAIIIIAGIFFAVPRMSNTQKQSSSQTPQTSKITNGLSKSNDDSNSSSDNAPLKLASWQTKSVNSQMNNGQMSNELNSAIQNWIKKDSSLTNTTRASFSSEKNGFTSDKSKAENSDGTINPKYSYLTTEKVNEQYALTINMLLNPEFGSWNQAQYSDNGGKSSKTLGNLQPLFTDSWWKSNVSKNDYSKLPVYADWNANDYHGRKFADKSNGRWFVSLTSESISPITKNDGSFKELDITDKVTFYANGKDGKVMTKKGTLKLTMVENMAEDDSNSNRLLINQASLTID